VALGHLNIAAMGSGDVDEESTVFVGPMGHEHYIGVECSSYRISG
jgi:hypothetical protein